MSKLKRVIILILFIVCIEFLPNIIKPTLATTISEVKGDYNTNGDKGTITDYDLAIIAGGTNVKVGNSTYTWFNLPINDFIGKKVYLHSPGSYGESQSNTISLNNACCLGHTNTNTLADMGDSWYKIENIIDITQPGNISVYKLGDKGKITTNPATTTVAAEMYLRLAYMYDTKNSTYIKDGGTVFFNNIDIKRYWIHAYSTLKSSRRVIN